MSWGLFNHNTRNYSAKDLAPDGGVLFSENVYSGSTAISNSQFPDGLIGANGLGRAISHDNGSFIQSLDYGETWETKGAVPPPVDDAEYVSKILWHPGGAWFVAICNTLSGGGSKDSHVYMSTDGGENWSELSYPYDYYATNNIAIDSSGTLFVASSITDGGQCYIHKMPDPINSDSGSRYLANSYFSVNTSCLVVTGVNVYHFYTILAVNRISKSLNSRSDIGSTSSNILNGSIDANDDLVMGVVTISGSTATLFMIEDGDSAPFDQVSIDFGESIQGCRLRFASGLWVACGLPSLGRGRVLIKTSVSGANGSWSDTTVVHLSESRKSESSGSTSSSIVDVEYIGGTWWAIGYRNESSYLRIDRFALSDSGLVDGAVDGLSRAINSQSPDIFLKLDDTGSPSTVTDIGRKGYANAVSQTVTFGEAGLVPDSGTAALFGDGSITVNVTAGAYQHAHLLILSHDDTASERTLLSFNGFTLNLAADDTVVFSDGDKTLASAAVAADTATLVALHFEKIACGTKANLYVGATHAGQALSELEPASSGDLVLGGAGVTIDYYAMIPSANADVAALQRAFGLSPSLPNAPTSALCGDVKLLVRADDAPVLQQVKPPSLGYWIDAYTIKNIATGEREVYWWKDGGDSVHQAAGGKFDGGLYVPDISPGSASRYPQSEPAWLGYAGLDLGTRDFSLSAWVKPGANGFFHLGISTRYKIQSGYSIPYGGFAFTVFITPAGPGSWVTVGQPLGAYGPGSPRSQRFALQEEFSPFPSYTPNDWNFVTLCRKAGRFYVTVNGRLPGNRSMRSGRQGAPIVSPGAGAELCMGWNEATNSAVSGQSSRLSRLAYRGTFDDLVLVLDEALYTQEFTPPNSRFELS